jgi:uncharacterized protein
MSGLRQPGWIREVPEIILDRRAFVSIVRISFMRAPQGPYAIKLREIPADGLHRDYDLVGAFAGQALHGTEVTATSLVADVDLQRSGEDVYVQGAMRGKLAAACSRCLGPAPIDLDARFAVTFMPGEAEEVTDEEVEVTDEQVDVKHYTDDELDLEETLREELLLAMPIAPVCRDACKGLCPTCGKDLNEGSCGCAPEPKDDRWAALRNLKV